LNDSEYRVETIWKETAVTKFKVISQQCVAGKMRSMKNISNDGESLG